MRPPNFDSCSRILAGDAASIAADETRKKIAEIEADLLSHGEDPHLHKRLIVAREDLARLEVANQGSLAGKSEQDLIERKNALNIEYDLLRLELIEADLPAEIQDLINKLMMGASVDSTSLREVISTAETQINANLPLGKTWNLSSLWTDTRYFLIANDTENLFSTLAHFIAESNRARLIGVEKAERMTFLTNELKTINLILQRMKGEDF